MISTLRKALERRLAYRNVSLLFLSNSSFCPCHKTYKLSETIRGIKKFLITVIDSIEAKKTITAINSRRNLIVYVHGEGRTSRQFSIYEKQGTQAIPNNWWVNLRLPNRIAYFHTCYGADILKRSLASTFPSWVSYSESVGDVQSSDPIIEGINRRFLERIAAEVSARKNVQALRAAVESTYKQIEADLYNQGEAIRGYTTIIAMVGTNVQSIVTSSN